MPERRENAEIRNRLQAIQIGYEKWTKATVRLLTILFLIQLGLGSLAVYLVTQNQQRSDETRALLLEVQGSRRQGVIITCREQNDRHDHTIKTLDRVISELPAGPQRDRAKSSRDATILLIEALAPKRDCEKRADQLVGPLVP